MKVLPRPQIVVDGVFFQYRSSGIVRVWSALLDEWSKSGFIEHIIFLARGGLRQPQISGLRCLEIAAHDYEQTGSDSLELERICCNLNSDLFVSTYYTTPTRTPSLFFGYDMIPEMCGVDLAREIWREKRRAILHAVAHLMISENSARDIERIYQLPVGSAYIAHCGVWKSFYRPEPAEITSFRTKYDLGDRPYLLMVGDRRGVGGYKNGELVFRAIGKQADQTRFTVICVGGHPLIEPEFLGAAPRARIRRLAIGDNELRAAYAGAHAFLYPSRYEGFGMPILEAMACGAPVITCPNSSVVEVAGNAALFVNEDDSEGMLSAIESLCDRTVRTDLIARGSEQATKFSFAAMAERVAYALLETHRRLSYRQLAGPGPVWEDLRETLKAHQELQSTIRGRRQRMRKRLIEAARRIGLDPANNRAWARFRAVQRSLVGKKSAVQ